MKRQDAQTTYDRAAATLMALIVIASGWFIGCDRKAVPEQSSATLATSKSPLLVDMPGGCLRVSASLKAIAVDGVGWSQQKSWTGSPSEVVETLNAGRVAGEGTRIDALHQHLVARRAVLQQDASDVEHPLCVYIHSGVPYETVSRLVSTARHAKWGTLAFAVRTKDDGMRAWMNRRVTSCDLTTNQDPMATTCEWCADVADQRFERGQPRCLYPDVWLRGGRISIGTTEGERGNACVWPGPTRSGARGAEVCSDAQKAQALDTILTGVDRRTPLCSYGQLGASAEVPWGRVMASISALHNHSVTRVNLLAGKPPLCKSM